MKDIIIAGAGPAGLIAAETAAKKGLDTLIIEKKKKIRNKPCGGGITPAALKKFKIKCKGKKIRKLVFKINGVSSEIKLDKPILSVYRKEFNNYLLSRALNAGAKIKFNKEYNREKAKVIILATGANLKAKDTLALAVQTEIKHYNSNKIELFYGKRISPYGYGWVFPKEKSTIIGVGCLMSKLTNLPKIKDYLNKILKEKELKAKKLEVGFIPFIGPIKKTYSKNRLIVGDAAGFVSPFSGEGIYYAMSSGKIAAQIAQEHIKSGIPLYTYEKKWKKEFGKILRLNYLFARTVYGNEKILEFFIKELGKNKALQNLVKKHFMEKKVSFFDIIKSVARLK
ncbi:hypothetical protein B6U80_02090 [Candidatus Pacearchaeota archaeon ex4484_26]|nr:MAG: hypothetical protein B6U80_02090 [Candidatus Pacearchaeota archaeon ex4484_26]